MGKNGTWAVKCHGWVKLSDEQFASFSKSSQADSRWAIIKDYIPNETTAEDLPELQRKMLIARRARLHPRDLKPENYRGSFIVDLGEVRTYPYVDRLWSGRLRRRCFDCFNARSFAWELPDENERAVPGHPKPIGKSDPLVTEAKKSSA